LSGSYWHAIVTGARLQLAKLEVGINAAPYYFHKPIPSVALDNNMREHSPAAEFSPFPTIANG
jgi:hypothetical protein